MTKRVRKSVTDVRIITSFVQIENLLISNQGTIKLCDFGSSTTVSHYPDYSWSAQKRSMVEDEVCIYTHTLSYIHNPRMLVFLYIRRKR